MNIALDTKVQFISGVGPKMAAKLNKLGIETVRDLLFYFPRKYLDYTAITQIKDLSDELKTQTRLPDGQDSKLKTNETFTIKGSIIGIANKKTRRRGFTVTEAVVADDSGSIKVVWFNQPYLVKMLRAGSSVVLNGKVLLDPFSNSPMMESPARANYPRIVSIYSEIVGISSYLIAKLFCKVVHLVNEIAEYLPLQFLNPNFEFSPEGRSPSGGLNKSRILNDKNDKNKYSNKAIEQLSNLGLLPIQDAILNIHQPKNAEMLERAQRRLAFDELFFISLRANLTNLELKKEKALPIKVDIEKLKKKISKLPFELTGDQKKALWTIMLDMEKNIPMNRLLNGDVGSGKTIVAALASWVALQAGGKTLVMCPTTILANQHYESFKSIFDRKQIGLITSSKKENETAPMLIGTQAFLHLKEKVKDLALVVADEQHRFGVAQRAALHNLHGSKLKPHFLSMTATPIPRTLYLALFGDLDISVIKEKPADRKEIKTRFVEPENREKAYEFIRNQINNGRQAFVICPLIEEKNSTDVILNGSEESHQHREILRFTQDDTLFEEERKSVKAEFEKLKKIFPEFKIEMLHGKMSPKGGSASGGKAKSKEEVVADFSSNRVQILVSTSVVEVGVDIPNATVMMIEDAERFGLAQIHQFRGRVGRAEYQSYCFLFSNSQSERALQRLRSLETVSDGFKLAEIDLETRGPGAVFGTEQSGLLDLKMASLSDRILIEEASEAAKRIAPKIDNYPLLKVKISEYISSKHLE